MTGFKRVLLATDFSECSEAALEVAMDLASRCGATLTIAHVCEVPPMASAGMSLMPVDLLTPLQDAANQMMERLLEAVKKRMPAARGLQRTGVAWEQILTAAKQSDADVIVLGT